MNNRALTAKNLQLLHNYLTENFRECAKHLYMTEYVTSIYSSYGRQPIDLKKKPHECTSSCCLIGFSVFCLDLLKQLDKSKLIDPEENTGIKWYYAWSTLFPYCRRGAEHLIFDYVFDGDWPDDLTKALERITNAINLLNDESLSNYKVVKELKRLIAQTPRHD